MLMTLDELLKLHGGRKEDRLVWWLSEEDVQDMAESKLNRRLSDDELREVIKGIEAGLGDWHVVVETALDDIRDEDWMHARDK